MTLSEEEQYNEKIKDLKPLLEKEEENYFTVKNRMAMYQLAKGNSKVAKYAKEAIKIREELGENPKIVKMEKSIVDFNKENEKSKSELIKSIARLLFVTASLTLLSKTQMVSENFINQFGGLITLILFSNAFSRITDRIPGGSVSIDDDDKTYYYKEEVENNLRELYNEIEEFQNDTDLIEIEKGKSI